MAKWEFLTVGEELLGHAAAVADYFAGLGYTVAPEKRELEYPFAPTLRCKRRSTTYFVELDESPPLDRLKEWVAFARSLKGDTRVVLAVPDHVTLSGRTHMTLKNLGVGLLIVSDSDVKEAMPPQDLPLNLELPDISQASSKLRKELGPVYEQFERNQWREGFEDACVALEAAAREHLWRAVHSGRTVVLKKNGAVKPLTKKQIFGKTIGALAVDFSNLQQQNHSDSVIAATLTKINTDRIRVAHKKTSATAERALRRNVGQQMWRIVGALREIYKP